MLLASQFHGLRITSCGKPTSSPPLNHHPMTDSGDVYSLFTLAMAAYVFSVWVWNRCCAAGGTHTKEHWTMDIAFALSVTFLAIAYHLY